MMYKYPKHLYIKGRKKLPIKKLSANDKLFHGFDDYDINEVGQIKLESIRFPDFSCNWSLFSYPKDVRYRKNGNLTDGCYSFLVNTARYKKYATPVHDPIFDKKCPNYSHVEVRELRDGEDILTEPPKGRSKKKSKLAKSQRLEYRQNLLLNSIIELNIEE